MIYRKIAGVFGTQNVGKTTFVNDLVSHTNGWEERWTLFGRDYRKEIESRGLKINRDGTEDSQKAIHEILVQNVVDAVNDTSGDNLIMDRTPIDSYVYTKWHNQFGNGGISDSTINGMWRQVLRFCRLFDILVYIPLDKCADVEVVDDRFRDTNLEYRRQIDEIMGNVFILLKGSLTMTHVDMLYGSRERRVSEFLSMAI